MPESPTRVAIVGGARTPFAKAGGIFKRHNALDLATHAVNGLLRRHDLDPARVDEMVYGIVVLDPRRPRVDVEPCGVVFHTGQPRLRRRLERALAQRPSGHALVAAPAGPQAE